MTDTNSQMPLYSQYSRDKIIQLYLATLLLLVSSFFSAMLATRVAPSTEIIGLENLGRHDVNPEVVTGREYIGLDRLRYEKVLIAEYLEVFATNVHTNNLKATRLSLSQLLAFAAGVTLVGISVIAIMGVLLGSRNQNPHTRKAPILNGKREQSSGEQKCLTIK